jgi:hypothetical protein
MISFDDFLVLLVLEGLSRAFDELFLNCALDLTVKKALFLPYLLLKSQFFSYFIEFLLLLLQILHFFVEVVNQLLVFNLFFVFRWILIAFRSWNEILFLKLLCLNEYLRLIANCYLFRIYLLHIIIHFDWLDLLLPELLQIFLLDLRIDLSLALFFYFPLLFWLKLRNLCRCMARQTGIGFLLEKGFDLNFIDFLKKLLDIFGIGFDRSIVIDHL